MNSTKRLVLALCTAAFLFAQFWSFAAAATLLESIDTDPCNDICLEDVISVDPFVGGSCGAFGSDRADSSSANSDNGFAMAGLGFVAADQSIFCALFVIALLAGYHQPERLCLVPFDELQQTSNSLAVRELIGKLQV
ncbi:MAG: hypothetical protein WC714_08660 [Candidatus Obscuribacterales bacterium]